jgi:hypothetical protein
MAGSAVVGALRITLGLDSAQFTSGMKTAQTGLQKFASVAKAGALAIGTAMVTAGGAMAVAMKGVIDRADRMYEVSQSLGVAVEDLSRMQYAAELSGVSLEGLEKSIRKLSVGLYDASQSATGPAAEAFRALGISATNANGGVRPVIDVMGDLAARFETMPDGVTKTALAIKVFGRSGADMIPMLNEGRAGLTSMYEEAERLGIVLDTETAAAAERFNDNLTRLGKVQDGIITKITAGMLPALDRLAAATVKAANDSEGLKAVGRGLGIVMNGLIAVLLGVAGGFWALGLAAADYAKIAVRLAKLDFSGAIAAWDNRGNAAAQSLRNTGNQIRALFTAVAPTADAIGGLADTTEDLADTTTRAGRATRGLTDAQRDTQAAAAESARVFADTRTELEKYNTELARLEALRARGEANGGISQDTFNRARAAMVADRERNNPLAQAAERIRDQNAEAAQRARQDAIDLAADHEESLRDATYDGIRGGLQAAADGNLGQYLAQRLRDALFDNLADTLTNMLRGPKGSSGGGAMGWLKSAGSVLKSFSGGKIPGFKTGGSFKVGGSGGSDSQLMQFRATPGEMVDIRRPGQDQGSGAMAVHVVPSPYFDVQVEKVSSPGAARAGLQAVGVARSQVPADDARRRRFSLTGGR